jgi:hydroxypyruvate reductase
VSPRLNTRFFLTSLFEAAVTAASPEKLIPGRLPSPPPGRVLVVGAGKAAAAMARAVEDSWEGPLDQLAGVVVTRYGHGVPTRRIEVIEAAHPVPDAAGREAAGRILSMVRDLGADDLLICLISGGGSALLASPLPGISLEDKQAVNRALLRCGAPIDEINCVRKHLSAIKGGRLAAAAHPARVVTYLISDVPGDDPSVVASGPTIPDPTTYADALKVLAKYGVDAPPAARVLLRAGLVAAQPQLSFNVDDADRILAAAIAPETPKPGDPAFARDEVVVLATARHALAAAAAVARTAGVAPIVLGDAVEGEARDVAAAHARLALALARRDAPSAEALLRGGLVAFSAPACDLDPLSLVLPRLPCVLISGGETTVTVNGAGRGGRDAEYALALAVALDGHPAVSAIACDTDGIDGTEDNAGAIVVPDTLARAGAAGLDAAAMLADNDAYSLFAKLDDLVVTGPTRTNVNDFRAVLVFG